MTKVAPIGEPYHAGAVANTEKGTSFADSLSFVFTQKQKFYVKIITPEAPYTHAIKNGTVREDRLAPIEGWAHRFELLDAKGQLVTRDADGRPVNGDFGWWTEPGAPIPPPDLQFPLLPNVEYTLKVTVRIPGPAAGGLNGTGVGDALFETRLYYHLAANDRSAVTNGSGGQANPATAFRVNLKVYPVGTDITPPSTNVILRDSEGRQILESGEWINGTFTFEIFLNDRRGGGTGVRNVRYTLDGTDPETSQTAKDEVPKAYAGVEYDAVVRIPFTTDGAFVLRYVAYDQMGNKFSSAEHPIRIDTKPPRILEAKVWPERPEPTQNVTFKIKAFDENDITAITLFFRGLRDATTRSIDVPVEDFDEDGYFDIDIGPLAEGDYIWWVTVRDPAGKTGEYPLGNPATLHVAPPLPGVLQLALSYAWVLGLIAGISAAAVGWRMLEARRSRAPARPPAAAAQQRRAARPTKVATKRRVAARPAALSAPAASPAPAWSPQPAAYAPQPQPHFAAQPQFAAPPGYAPSPGWAPPAYAAGAAYPSPYAGERHVVRAGDAPEMVRVVSREPSGWPYGSPHAGWHGEPQRPPSLAERPLPTDAWSAAPLPPPPRAAAPPGASPWAAAPPQPYAPSQPYAAPRPSTGYAPAYGPPAHARPDPYAQPARPDPYAAAGYPYPPPYAPQPRADPYAAPAARPDPYAAPPPYGAQPVPHADPYAPPALRPSAAARPRFEATLSPPAQLPGTAPEFARPAAPAPQATSGWGEAPPLPPPPRMPRPGGLN